MICAVKGGAEEGAFKKTVELDRMIDALKDANPREVGFCHSTQSKCFIFLCCLVPFFLWNSLRSLSLKTFLPLMKFFGLDWLPGRILASQMMTRQAFLLFLLLMIKQIFFKLSFSLMSLLQKDYEELAATVMTIVDCVVNKTRVFFSSSLFFWAFHCLTYPVLLVD